MTELEELLKDINRLRENLYKKIEQNSYELDDPEVLETSKRLNTVIVNYNAMINKKI
jgi:hypothetical protein